MKGTINFRGKIIRLGEAPLVEPSLHLYALGCRSWGCMALGLHGMEQKILAKEEFQPAVKKKIAELQSEITRLEKERPAGWLDRRRRYEDAVAGLRLILGETKGN